MKTTVASFEMLLESIDTQWSLLRHHGDIMNEAHSEVVKYLHTRIVLAYLQTGDTCAARQHMQKYEVVALGVSQDIHDELTMSCLREHVLGYVRSMVDKLGKPTICGLIAKCSSSGCTDVEGDIVADYVEKCVVNNLDTEEGESVDERHEFCGSKNNSPSHPCSKSPQNEPDHSSSDCLLRETSQLGDKNTPEDRGKSGISENGGLHNKNNSVNNCNNNHDNSNSSNDNNNHNNIEDDDTISNSSKTNKTRTTNCSSNSKGQTDIVHTVKKTAAVTPLNAAGAGGVDVENIVEQDCIVSSTTSHRSKKKNTSCNVTHNNNNSNNRDIGERSNTNSPNPANSNRRYSGKRKMGGMSLFSPKVVSAFYKDRLTGGMSPGKSTPEKSTSDESYKTPTATSTPEKSTSDESYKSPMKIKTPLNNKSLMKNKSPLKNTSQSYKSPLKNTSQSNKSPLKSTTPQRRNDDCSPSLLVCDDSDDDENMLWNFDEAVTGINIYDVDDNEEDVVLLQLQEKKRKKGTSSGSGGDGVKKVKSRRRRVKFSEVEEQYVIDGVAAFGVGNWSNILHAYDFHSCRDNVSIKDKFRNLVKQGRIVVKKK